MFPALAGGFFTTSATWEAQNHTSTLKKKRRFEAFGIVYVGNAVCVDNDIVLPLPWWGEEKEEQTR